MRSDELSGKKDKLCGNDAIFERTYASQKVLHNLEHNMNSNVLVNKIVCSKQVHIVAETIISLSSLGITLPPGATTIPPITVTPDLSGIVQNSIILKDEVITTGYVPATITVEGLPTTVTANLPFQQHIPCPGACPEDILSVASLEVVGIIIQPVPSVVFERSALFIVILRTRITVTRPTIGKPDQKSFSYLNDVAHQRTEKIPHMVPFTPFGPQCTAPDVADDVLVNKIVCSRPVRITAESSLIVFTSPELLPLPITLTPDLEGIVLNSTILKDAVVTAGYVPVSVTVGILTTVTLDLPFQQLTPCPGACPVDILTAAPAEIEAIIIQPIPIGAPDGVVELSIMFKVILRTKITVTRPMIGKLNQKSSSCLKGVCPHHPEVEPRRVQFPLIGAENATLTTESDIENLKWTIPYERTRAFF
ncbi:hypothetical protein [Siminovitchia fortis]|uniref:Uncharacterized protein n=1 Tax=Siminovitchia fortis TaxID=254758 RepID=A0A443ILM6_9BACI|nr:hypothetical protein [Siminovitchia fortis]RWR06328.1 hypothetical protein D4N35_014235 [Siminovitchia fortis]WHY82166.1 hypothetical protein QNH23_01680 [Siminovitchia fortis]